MMRNNEYTAGPVEPGGTIGVCAPAGSFDSRMFQAGVSVLREMGFEVYLPDTIYSRRRYLAGDDVIRAETLNRLYAEPEVDGIICARGGYGSMRMLDHLDWDTIQANPKPFVGFSDITAILVRMVEHSVAGAIHGPVVTSLAYSTERTRRSLAAALSGKENHITITDPVVLKKGESRGILSGGNLATLSHLAGTLYQPSFQNRLFFMEDTAEPPYKIDRMLTQLRMAGCFEGVKGVIVGALEKCEPEEMVHEIVTETFDEYDVPVMAGMDAGHGKDNLCLAFGTAARMDTATGILHCSGGR
ncbi:MAG: LD-carboxypeptidase [Desulfarculaceae bacterium]|nr:LD-carboxypeptidase [Desulfarculaceae bacterium]